LQLPRVRIGSGPFDIGRTDGDVNAVVSFQKGRERSVETEHIMWTTVELLNANSCRFARSHVDMPA
jgi:hypothetical protein